MYCLIWCAVVSVMSISPEAASRSTMLTSATNPPPAQERRLMSDNTSSIQPRLSTERALRRILELIRVSQTTAEFTRDRLHQVMDVPIMTRGDGYGFGEKLTSKWAHGFDVSSANGRLRFGYQIGPSPPVPPSDPSPTLEEICQLGFEEFAAELEAMGFSRKHHYDDIASADGARLAAEAASRGQHFDPGPPLVYFDNFYRPGMNIDVYPEGQSRDKPNHYCVKMLFIN
jgi:hypothetical protein